MLQIKVFGTTPPCASCMRAEKQARIAAEAFGDQVEVLKLDAMGPEADEYGIMSTPLVVVGASTFITVDPSNPFYKFTTLPIQIYQWTARPQDEFRNIAAAAILVLLLLLLTLNATAVLLRNRYSRRRYS